MRDCKVIKFAAMVPYKIVPASRHETVEEGTMKRDIEFRRGLGMCGRHVRMLRMDLMAGWLRIEQWSYPVGEDGEPNYCPLSLEVKSFSYKESDIVGRVVTEG